MVPNWWPESSKIQVKHGLPYIGCTIPWHGAIPLALHCFFLRKSCVTVWANPGRSLYLGSISENHTHVKPMTSKGAISGIRHIHAVFDLNMWQKYEARWQLWTWTQRDYSLLISLACWKQIGDWRVSLDGHAQLHRVVLDAFSIMSVFTTKHYA